MFLAGRFSSRAGLTSVTIFAIIGEVSLVAICPYGSGVLWKLSKRMIGSSMAHTKAIGTTRNGRDSQPSYLGVKLSSGQTAKTGNIIIRQRGTSFLPGTGVSLGKDYTIYAMMPGIVKFTTKRKTGFNGDRRVVKVVSVVPN